jgi:hypothetical protein
MPTGPGAAILGQEFAFIPSVLGETAIDLENLIGDPNFIEFHFTEDWSARLSPSDRRSGRSSLSSSASLRPRRLP